MQLSAVGVSPLLADEYKDQIQQAYSAWLDARGFRGRRGQRAMIADIARTFAAAGDVEDRASGEHICVIEAGTGIGKTVAYLIPAIPIAQALGKKLIVATATVNLQEQLVLRDLPDLAQHSGMRFSAALAKGRGRYVCLERLDRHLRNAEVESAELQLFEEELVSEERRQLFGSMLAAVADGSWAGDRDSWAVELEDDLWARATTDHRACAGPRCGFFRQCPFFRARDELQAVDVIVANHDLVLADLALGGGALLAAPQDAIYVFDEGHNLADKALGHFRYSARLRGTVRWLEGLGGFVGSMVQRLHRPPELEGPALELAQVLPGLSECLGALRITLEQALSLHTQGDGRARHRFPHGRVPDELGQPSRVLADGFESVAGWLQRMSDALEEAMEGKAAFAKAFEAQDWYPALGNHISRAFAQNALWYDLAEPGPEPRARWVTRVEYEDSADLEISSCPLLAASILEDSLWTRCHAALVTSATLTALGSFDRLQMESGVPDGALMARYPSPFDYERLGVFQVPAMRSDPRDQAAHDGELAELLPRLIDPDEGTLLLFMSWRQLRSVLAQLPDDITSAALVQGSLPRHAMLEEHRARRDRGEGSAIFGLQSFAEGIDLEGHYLGHVIIAKLPFGVPDDPIAEGLSEWVEDQGRNAFYTLAVPDAALRLVQACGRLIRSEEDHGRITLLDPRIVTKRYGRDILDSLPPFRRELNLILDGDV